jgi:sirohydrochlorin cobaltochelatase
MSHAVLLVGHGSRDPEGVAEFLNLDRGFRGRCPDLPVEIAFLEFARPTIQESIDRLARDGHSTILVIPGVLLAAGHAKNDIASEVRRARLRHPLIDIRMGAALEIDHHLLQLCRLRYQEAVAGWPVVDPADTLLLLVGRGSSDPDANANLAKVARFLQEGYPAGWASWAYVGIARPFLEDALPVCERAGFRRIVVQPYFLFTGVLLKRIYALVEERRRARPDLDIVAVPHLQAHPLLLDAFEQRIAEVLEGTGHMNCSLCQYRVPIIGCEQHVGDPQQPHHHHVQGIHGHVHYLEEERHHHHSSTRDLTPAGDDPHAWHPVLLEQLQF